MRLISTTVLTLSLALAASSTPLKRQTPDRFALVFASSGGEPESVILVSTCGNEGAPQRECLISNPNPDLVGPSELLVLDSNFVFTSGNTSPTGGQALILNTKHAQTLDLTVAHGGYIIPEGFTRDGFSVIGGELAFNGSTNNFFGCLLWAAPGGRFPLYAPDPIDFRGLGAGGCTQQKILAKTFLVGP